MGTLGPAHEPKPNPTTSLAHLTLSFGIYIFFEEIFHLGYRLVSLWSDIQSNYKLSRCVFFVRSDRISNLSRKLTINNNKKKTKKNMTPAKNKNPLTFYFFNKLTYTIHSWGLG